MLETYRLPGARVSALWLFFTTGEPQGCDRPKETPRPAILAKLRREGNSRLAPAMLPFIKHAA